MTNPAAAYFVARLNRDFNTPELLDRTGVYWTLHEDKAQALTFEQACRAIRQWHPEASVIACDSLNDLRAEYDRARGV